MTKPRLFLALALTTTLLAGGATAVAQPVQAARPSEDRQVSVGGVAERQCPADGNCGSSQYWKRQYRSGKLGSEGKTGTFKSWPKALRHDVRHAYKRASHRQATTRCCDWLPDTLKKTVAKLVVTGAEVQHNVSSCWALASAPDCTRQHKFIQKSKRQYSRGVFLCGTQTGIALFLSFPSWGKMGVAGSAAFGQCAYKWMHDEWEKKP